MASPIKYDSVHLYAKRMHPESSRVRAFLNKNGVKFADLQYSPELEVVEACLAPLNTWFDGVVFEDLPILVFDAVFWEAEDGPESYRVRQYAIAVSELPDNFLELVEKTS